MALQVSAALLLISDTDPSGGSVHDALPWTIVPLRDAATERPPAAAIATDVALDDPVSVDLLRTALARHRGVDVPLVVLVRDRCIVTHARANGLGATDILPIDAPPALIAESLRCRGSRDAGFVMPAKAATGADVTTAAANDDAGLPLEKAIATVEATLTGLLSSARDRKPVDGEALHRGADVLVAAIKDRSVREWVDLVRRYDDMTYQHVLLVAGLVTALAIRLGCSPARQNLLAQSALVHDIGKSIIPTAILNKPGPLTADEMAVVRTHPSRGYYMIAHQRGIDAMLLDVVLNHHEYLDGSGYPNKRRGREISEAARLVTICDIYGALIERRSYKAPIAPHVAYAMLFDMGGKLDSGMVSAFSDVVESF